MNWMLNSKKDERKALLRLGVSWQGLCTIKEGRLLSCLLTSLWPSPPNLPPLHIGGGYRRSPITTLEASFRSIPVAATPHQSVMAQPSSLAATDSPGSHIRNYISTLVRRAGAYVPRFAPSFLCRAWRKLQGLTRSTTLIHRHWGERRVW